MSESSTLKQLVIWQQEATDECCPIRWLPFWRPKVLVKRGYFSPWYWPPLWATKSGVFNLFFLIIISEDLLFCEPHHRRAIIAHECGHLSGFHTPISMLAIALSLNDHVRIGLADIGAHFGPWSALAAFLAVLVVIIGTLRLLLYWFEHQADDYACGKVGAADMVATLTWLNERSFGSEGSGWINGRIRRLQRLHPSAV